MGDCEALLVHLGYVEVTDFDEVFAEEDIGGLRRGYFDVPVEDRVGVKGLQATADLD